MKNLSLLLLALIALPIEASYDQLAVGDTATKRTRPKRDKLTPSTQGSADTLALTNHATSDEQPAVAVIDTQPSTINSAFLTTLPQAASMEEYASPLVTARADSPHFAQLEMNALLVDCPEIIIKSNEDSNEGRSDKRLRRFENTDEIAAALRAHHNPVAMKGGVCPLSTKIRHTKGLTLQQSEEQLDEETRLKESFAPVIKALQSDELEVKTKSGQRITGTNKIPRSQLFKDDSSAAETPSGSTHEIYGTNGSSKLSFLEIMPHIYNSEARAAKPLTKLFEAARQCELEISLLKLEEFESLSDLEAKACQHLTALQEEKRQVISSSNEANRIENERVLARIAREITGVEAQYKTIQDDRERKRTLIAQLRDQIGAQVAGVGLLRWASGKTDSTRPTLQAIFHNTRATELAAKREKTMAFLEYLKTIPTPKAKSLRPIKISTGLQDPRSFKFALVMESKKAVELVALSQQEDQGLGSVFSPSSHLPIGTQGEEAVRVDKYEMPKHIQNAPTLAALYTARVSEPTNLLHSRTVHTSIPTLEELHERRDERPHWSGKGYDARTLEWKQVVPTATA